MNCKKDGEGSTQIYTYTHTHIHTWEDITPCYYTQSNVTNVHCKIQTLYVQHMHEGALDHTTNTTQLRGLVTHFYMKADPPIILPNFHVLCCFWVRTSSLNKCPFLWHIRGNPLVNQAPALSGRLTSTEATILHSCFTHQHTYSHLQFHILRTNSCSGNTWASKLGSWLYTRRYSPRCTSP